MSAIDMTMFHAKVKTNVAIITCCQMNLKHCFPACRGNLPVDIVKKDTNFAAVEQILHEGLEIHNVEDSGMMNNPLSSVVESKQMHFKPGATPLLRVTQTKETLHLE